MEFQGPKHESRDSKRVQQEENKAVPGGIARQGGANFPIIVLEQPNLKREAEGKNEREDSEEEEEKEGLRGVDRRGKGETVVLVVVKG